VFTEILINQANIYLYKKTAEKKQKYPGKMAPGYFYP